MMFIIRFEHLNSFGFVYDFQYGGVNSEDTIGKEWKSSRLDSYKIEM